MKNKQTNRRLLSLLLSLCLMLSLVTPAMATGEETAGQETGQTTACPTEIKAVTVTLEATRWPDGEEKPAPITITTANVFGNENGYADIYVELSGRSSWSNMYLITYCEAEEYPYELGHYIRNYESCGLANWTEKQTGSLNYRVSVCDSNSLENATVVYGAASLTGETAPEGVTVLTTYAATKEEFPALTADQFQQEMEWWSTADFNGNPTVMLPQGMLDGCDSSELSMKVYDKNGQLCGATVSGNGVHFDENSMSDPRYEEIFQTDPYIQMRCTRAYGNIYLGHTLTAGRYDVRLYSGDALIREFPDLISVTDLPVVSVRSYSDIGANVAGGTTAYVTLTVSNGAPKDFSVAVYDGDECISSGMQTRLDNTYNGRIQLECIIGLTRPMEHGSYQLRVVSEQMFQLASGEPRLYVQEEDLISMELVNGVYANAVLFSAGYDPQQSYRVSLKKDDRTLATTYASPDENGVWDIEFTDDSGKLLELEEGSYNIYVETKYGGSGVGAYHQMYERSDSSGGSSGGSGGSGTVPEVSAPTADELPLTVSYSYAGPTNDRQFYAVLDVNKNCPNLSYITDKNSFVLVAHAMDGKTYQLPLSSMDQYEWDNVRRYRLNFAPGQATDGYYLFELYYGGRSVTNQTDHKNVAARDYAGLLSSRVEGNFSYNTPDTGVRITNWINVDNVSDGMATVSLYAFGNRTAVPDHTITVRLSEDGGTRLTAAHLAGLPLFRKYAGEISRDGSLVGGNSAEYGYFASEELTEGNQSFTAAVGSSDPNGKLQLLDYDGNDVNGTALRALEELYVAASPADGYRLKPNSIKVNGQSILGRSFLLTEDCTVTAEFEEIPEVTYAITTASYVRNGTISANVSRAAAGQTVTVTPQPNEGYVFSLGSSHATYRVKNEDGSSHSENIAFTRSSDGTITFEMPAADVELYAYFRTLRNVNVSLNVKVGGSYNDELKNAVRITDANENSVVDGTAVEGSTINYLFPQEYTSADGTIYRLSDAYYRYSDQDIGEQVETAVTDAPQGSLTLSYTSSISFNAEYVRYAKYNVTTGSANGGTITVSPASAYPGETITVTVTPEEGYILKTGDLWLSGSGSTEIKRISEDTFTFVMPGADVTVNASFQNKAYISVNVDSNVSGNGSLQFETSQYANSGTIAKVRTVAAEGSHLADIYAMTTDSLGNPCRIELTLDDSGCYTFTVPSYDVTVYATFMLNRFGGDAKDVETLIAALGGKAAQVDNVTVRLIADVTLTESLRITGGTLKLLLDGHNICYYDGTEAAIVVDGANADFTIDGVSRISQDTVERTNGIRGESGGALDVRSGKLTVLGGGYYGGVHIGAGASAVIQSGTPASGMMAEYEAEPTIVSGSMTPALHIEEGGTADIRNAYFFFDGDNCIMSLPDGKTLTDYTAGAKILAYIREEDETLTQIKTDYAKASVITVGVEGYSVTAAPAEGAVWNLKAEALPANVTAAIPITAKFGYTIKNVWYTTAASGGSTGSGTVVNSTAGGTTESSTSGGSSSGGSAAGRIWYGANSGRWYLNMPAAPITLHAEVEELSESTFKVEFLDDNGQLLSSQTVTAGGSVTAPDAPVRDGYTFIGWKDSTGTMVSDFNNITADMTLTAVYEAKQMTVTLFLDGGSFTDTKYQTEYSVQYGEEFVDLPPENALTRKGYTFDGWYGDIYYEKQFTSKSRIYESLILYAKWTEIPASYAVDSVYDAEKIQEWNIWTSTESSNCATAGSEVTFKFVAKAGFVCTELRCVGTSGRVYTIELGLSDYYDESGERLRTYKGYFTMPEEDITLTPVCVSAHGTITVKLSEGNITYVSAAGSEPWQTDYWPNGNSSASGTDTVSFSYLTNGTYLISGTTTSGYSFEKVVTLTENDPTQTVTITPEETYTVTGRLTNVPTDGVWLEVYRENGGCVASQWVKNSDFKFSIPAGPYTLRAFGKQEYPVRIGTDGTAEFTVSEEGNNVITAELVRLPSVKVTISAEQQIGKYAYLLLEQRNGDSWQYISSTICASANGTKVLLEDVIPASGGTYRLQLTDISRGYYSGYESFASDKVQFEVAENAETTIIEQTLSYSLPAEPVKSLTGSVTVDRTEVYGGELVDLAIRWKSESGDAVQPTFTLPLPEGVTLANSAQTTNLKPEKKATEGIFHVTLRVDKNAAGALRIPVQATLGDEVALFGTANLSIAKLMITAPVQVRVGETVTVYGEAAEGELVTIRNAATGTILAVVQAKGRYYSAKLALTGSAALVAETADGTVRSAQIMVKVVSDPIAVTGVTYGAYDEKAAYNERLNAYTFWQYVDLYMMGGDLPVSVSFSGSGIQSVKLSFCGLTQTATQSSDGAWTTIFKEGTWGASGLKYLTADVTTTSGETLHFVAAVVNLLIDPSGIVTDKNGMPLEGVTVYCQVLREDGQWVNFDAENYGQVNPQVTDKDGRYGWMVPEGEYRILAVKEGYQTYDSLNDEMFSWNGGSTIVIPPVRTDINFSMAPDTSKSYTIFPTAVENATIHCDRSNAAAGENVTLKASAASGYMLEAIRVTGVDSGKSYEVNDNSDGSYSFTMPAERVSYSATLAEAPTEVSVTANGNTGNIKVTGLKTLNVKLIAAFYAADGRMIAITMPTLTVNGTEATAAVQMQNGAKLRVFLLNSTTNAPLAQCAALALTRT